MPIKREYITRQGGSTWSDLWLGRIIKVTNKSWERRGRRDETKKSEVQSRQTTLYSTLHRGHLMTRMCPDSLIKDNSKHYTRHCQCSYCHWYTRHCQCSYCHWYTRHLVTATRLCCYMLSSTECHKKYSIMSYKKRDEKIPQVPTMTYMCTIHYNIDYMCLLLLLLLFIDSLGTSSSSMSARGSPPVAPPPPLLQLSWVGKFWANFWKWARLSAP